MVAFIYICSVIPTRHAVALLVASDFGRRRARELNRLPPTIHTSTMTVITETRTWQGIALEVQATRDESIAQVKPPLPPLPESLPSRVIDLPRSYLTQSELAITESSAEALVDSLAVGKLTATAVTKAFLRRAALAQKLVSESSPGVTGGPSLLTVI